MYRVAAFPTIEQLNQNPYWQILQTELAGKGIETIPTTQFSRRWLQQNRGQVDILHFHYIQPFYAYERTNARLRWVLRFARNLLLARIWGYRTVFTLHNLTPTYPLRPAWVDYLGHWIVTSMTDAVIVHCKLARQALAKRFGRRRNVHQVNHPHFIGIYPDGMLREEARAQLALKDDEVVYVFFGGIRPNKGLTRLLRTFSKLPGQHLRLIIAGKPWPPASYLDRLRELAMADQRVQLFAHFIEDQEVQKFLKAADVVVLPFASILTSSSAVLAMSFARPVLAPAMGCLSELIGPETGFLYKEKDDQGLIRCLQKSVHADLYNMGRAALERVSTFSHEDFAMQTMAAYGMSKLEIAKTQQI